MDAVTLHNLFVTLPEEDGLYIREIFGGECEDDSFCRVCRGAIDIGSSTKKEKKAHCRSRFHKAKVARLRKIQDNIRYCLRMAIDTRAETRARSLGSKRSQDAVYGMIARKMFKPNDDTEVAHVENVLRHYELIEATTVLELTLWKAACLMDMPQTAMNSYLEVMAWHQGGWKVNKQKLRRCGSIKVVIRGVLPFLSNNNGSL